MQKHSLKWGCALTLGKREISCKNFKSYPPLYSLTNDFLENIDQKLCFSFVEYFNSSKKKKNKTKNCVTVKLNKLILKQDVKVQRYTSSEFSEALFSSGLWAFGFYLGLWPGESDQCTTTGDS